MSSLQEDVQGWKAGLERCSGSPHQRQSRGQQWSSAALMCSGKNGCFLVLESDWAGLGSASWLPVHPFSLSLLPPPIPTLLLSSSSSLLYSTRVSLADPTAEHIGGFPGSLLLLGG